VDVATDYDLASIAPDQMDVENSLDIPQEPSQVCPPLNTMMPSMNTTSTKALDPQSAQSPLHLTLTSLPHQPHCNPLLHTTIISSTQE